MSSILKALKKIEIRKSETQLPVWPYRISNRESISRHTNRAWRRHQILGILIVVCTVALAGKLYIGHRTGAGGIHPEADPSVTTAPPTVFERVVRTEPLRVEAHGKDSVKSAPSPSSNDRESTPVTTLPPPPAAASKKTVAGRVPESAPMDDAGLTLQALVWSEEPESRFAVINGSILREGGVINDSAVDRIEPDYVTIRSGETTWRLKYRQ